MQPFSESRFLQHVRMLGLIRGQDRLGQAVQAEKSPEISVESTESTESPQTVNVTLTDLESPIHIDSIRTCDCHGPCSRGRESWRVSQGPDREGANILSAWVLLARAQSQDPQFLSKEDRDTYLPSFPER